MPGVAATISLQGDLPSTAAARRWAALGDALRLVWVIGIVLLVTRVVRRTVTAWSLGRVAIRMPPGLAGKLLAAPRALLGVGRPVTLKVVPAGSARNIGTVGLWRPVIFLPQSAMAWPLDRQRRVLMHEMSHVAHGDWAVRIGVDLIVALLWFHPFVWEAARQLRLGQEDAADDVVLRTDADPYTYATDLVDLAAAGRPWPHGGTSGDS
jgi:beta-lactamase regulating signal transducer with metallopeptidase domain